jgi:glycosyltransferase involved in cell wall biosynthesis
MQNAVRLIVFGDHWGGHPSSIQHLMRHIVARYPTLWVNTIGTRRPRLARDDLRRAAQYIRAVSSHDASANPAVVAPPMWPGFRTRWQRQLNAGLIARCVHGALGPRRGEFRLAITSVPITADLIGRLDVDRWVYYCVDDFSVWPGLDGSALHAMHEAQLRHSDQVIVTSEILGTCATRHGKRAILLTHGVDLDTWNAPVDRGVPEAWTTFRRPIWLFWGLIDARLDADWCRALLGGAAGAGTFVLVGPRSADAPELPGAVLPGPVGYAELPRLAAAADVLVMPYADLPVTRAMQPLKLKEYLATSRPVVVRDLPASNEWSDAADVVHSVSGFVEAVRSRSCSGTPAAQLRARRRLGEHSWSAKAHLFERLIFNGSAAHV